MKTEMMGTKWTGVFSKGLLTALLALPLGFVASCAVEPDQTSNDEQAVGGNCTIRHPYVWTVGGHTCRESSGSGASVVQNGDVIEMEATAQLGSGDGFAIIGCNNGVLQKSGTLNGVPLFQTCQ